MKGSSGGLFKKRASAFSKKVDAKLGKGFCTAVKASTLTPVFGGRIVGALTDGIVKTVHSKGLNGPMRTDGRYGYQQKCDMYIALFEKMVTPVVTNACDLHTFQYDTLYRMVDDGMFATLTYNQFIAQFRNLYLTFTGIESDDIDIFLYNTEVQKDLQGLWLA